MGAATPIEYLLEIERASLPLHVRDPRVIRAIAALHAAGCVEAEISPPLDLRGAFEDYESAVVKRITPEGWTELSHEYGSDEAGAAAARRIARAHESQAPLQENGR